MTPSPDGVDEYILASNVLLSVWAVAASVCPRIPAVSLQSDTFKVTMPVELGGRRMLQLATLSGTCVETGTAAKSFMRSRTLLILSPILIPRSENAVSITEEKGLRSS
jgi:hypothetical protein